MLSRFSYVQVFAILWTVAQQAPLSMGFSMQECWSELPCPSPGNLPKDWIHGSWGFWIAGGFFTTELLGKPLRNLHTNINWSEEWTPNLCASSSPKLTAQWPGLDWGCGSDLGLLSPYGSQPRKSSWPGLAHLPDFHPLSSLGLNPPLPPTPHRAPDSSSPIRTPSCPHPSLKLDLLLKHFLNLPWRTSHSSVSSSLSPISPTLCILTACP